MQIESPEALRQVQLLIEIERQRQSPMYIHCPKPQIQHSAYNTCDAKGANQVVRRTSLGMVWPRLPKRALQQTGRLVEVAEDVLRQRRRLVEAADMWRSDALHKLHDRANDSRRALFNAHIEDIGQLCRRRTSDTTMTLLCPTTTLVMSDRYDAAEGGENLGKAEGRSIPSCGAEGISIYHRAGPEDTLRTDDNGKQYFVPPATSTDPPNRLQLNGHERYVLDAPLSQKHQRRPFVYRNTDSTDPNSNNNHVEKPANQDPKGQQREQTKSALPLTPQQRIFDVRQPRHGPGVSARPGHRA